MDLSSKSDEYLVNLSKKNDKKAIDTLLKRYTPIIKIMSNSYFLIGGDREDLLQEGLLGLISAVSSYDISKNNRFYPFAKICINRRLIKAIDKSFSNKNKALNLSISLDNDNIRLSEYLIDEFIDPERLLLDKENEKIIRDTIMSILSKFEREVFTLLIQGYDYVKISEILKRPKKSIDNSIQRIKNKIKKLN